MAAVAVENSAQVNFVTRVLNLPVVGAAVQYTSGKYHAVRDRHPVVGSVVDTAYNTLIYAANMPVVQKFNGPIQAADSLACRTLDIVEERVPMIKKTPEQIAEDTKQLYFTLVEDRVRNNLNYVKGKFTTAKNYGEEQAQVFLKTTYGQQVSATVETALDNAGWYIDNYVPVPKGGDYPAQPVAGVEPGQTGQKVVLFKHKIERLILLHTQVQLNHLSRFLDHLSQLKTRSIDHVYAAYAKGIQLYDTVKIRSAQEGTLEHRLMVTAQHATDSAFVLMRGIIDTLSALPPGIQTALYKARDYLVQLKQSQKRANFANVYMSFVNFARDQTSRLQKAVDQFLKSIPPPQEMDEKVKNNFARKPHKNSTTNKKKL